MRKMGTKSKNLFVLSIFFALLTISVYFIEYNVVFSKVRYYATGEATATGPGIGGPACYGGMSILFSYDKNGNYLGWCGEEGCKSDADISQSFNAPIYAIKDEQLENIATEMNTLIDCPIEMPDHIDPEVLKSVSYEVYPLHIEMDLKDEFKIRQHESMSLEANAYFGDEIVFPISVDQPNEIGEALIWLPPGETLPLSFTLKSTNIKSSPNPGEWIQNNRVGIDHPAQVSWVISPETNASGNQIMIIAARLERPPTTYFYDFERKIRVDIQHNTGISYRVLTPLFAAGTVAIFIASMVAMTVNIFNIKDRLDTKQMEKNKKNAKDEN